MSGWKWNENRAVRVAGAIRFVKTAVPVCASSKKRRDENVIVPWSERCSLGQNTSELSTGDWCDARGS
jgi:hypothetical protein